MEQAIKKRTKELAIRIIRFAETLPRQTAFIVIEKQILRCATSVGANYRAACRAKSKGDFIAKLGIVEEEADETLYWLEIIAELEPESKGKAGELYKEMNEILSIVIASRKTATRNQTTGI